MVESSNSNHQIDHAFKYQGEEGGGDASPQDGPETKTAAVDEDECVSYE